MLSHTYRERLAAVALAGALLAVGCTPPRGTEGEPPPAPAKMVTPTEHLRSNHAILDLTQDRDLSAWALLDADLASHRVFFAGEWHSVALNYEVQWQALRYLSQKAGVTRYLAELPFSAAELINQYLQAGDERHLDLVHRQALGSVGGLQEGYEFWRKLYAYNQTVPAAQRIRVLGIDAELAAPTAFAYLEFLLPKQGAPPTLAPLLAEIARAARGANPYDRSYTPAMVDLHRRLQADLRSRPGEYRRYLGDRYADYEFTLGNIEQGIVLKGLIATDYPRFNSERERVLFANFPALAARHSGAKYFGQWGLEHTYLREHQAAYSENGPKLAQWLNQSVSETRGKVLTIAYTYWHSFTRNPGKEGGEAFLRQTMAHLNLLEPFAAGRPALFRVTGKDSPFAKELFFVEGGTGGVTTDYFQYLVFIPKSGAARLYADGSGPAGQ